jgi:hypothetical protein
MGAVTGDVGASGKALCGVEENHAAASEAGSTEGLGSASGTGGEGGESGADGGEGENGDRKGATSSAWVEAVLADWAGEEDWC